MTIKLVNDHKGNLAYVSKIAGSDGLHGNGARFLAGSNTIRTWNDYPTYEQAAAAWNDGSVVQELVEALEVIHEISQDNLNPCYQLVQEIAATARTALNKAKGLGDV